MNEDDKPVSNLAMEEWGESIPAGLVIISTKGCVIYFNRLASEMFAENLQCNESWESILKSSVTGSCENGYYLVLHSRQLVLLKTQSLPHGKGQIILLFDETEQLKNNLSQSKLEKLDLIGKISSTLAHQLRAPLSTAILYASLLCKEKYIEEQGYLQKLCHQLDLIQEQIDEVQIITKPVEAERLMKKADQLSFSKNQAMGRIIFEDIQTKKVIELANQVAQTDASIVISGESGTGKEVIAKYIHECSARVKEPFVAINCAAIPDNMLEALLFGFEKGAFTGAIQTTEGKLELANNGTLLLDEISEMPLALQAKLLRVLQEREVERLGGKKIIKLDIRVIATTNRSLQSQVEQGEFRQDLYFRLNVFPIFLPPLRSRTDDILPLANYYLKRYGKKELIYQLLPESKKILINHSWPGNVRELQNVIQRALILTNGCVIEPYHFLFEEREHQQAVNQTSNHLADQVIENENGAILKALNEMQGNRRSCAERLGISERTLRNKLSRMKKMGIHIPS